MNKVNLYKDDRDKVIKLLKRLKDRYRKWNKIFKRGYTIEKGITVEHFSFDGDDYLLSILFNYASLKLQLSRVGDSDNVLVDIETRSGYMHNDITYFRIKNLLRDIYTVNITKPVESIMNRRAFGLLGMLGYYEIMV